MADDYLSRFEGPGMEKLYQDKNWLEHQYVDLEKSMLKIAREQRCNYTTVCYWLEKYNFKILTNIERALLIKRFYQNREWLENQYLTLKKTILEIANECESNTYTIKNWLKRFGMATRSISEGRLVNQNHVVLSQKAFEFLNGELLGDGHLSLNKHSAVYRHTSKYKEHLVFLSKKLESFGIEQVGKIYKREGFTRFPNRYVWGTTFSYCSRAYPELKDLHAKWYRPTTEEERKVRPWRKFVKIVPRDLVLTPLACRQWHIGDGSDGIPNHCSITLSTLGFSVPEVDFLVRNLGYIGFQSSRQKDKCIRIRSGFAQGFLSYIGPCPQEIESIYGYK